MVMTGKDRGKTGFIGRLFIEKNQVWIDGVNQKVRHIKAREGQPGDKVTFFAPINASNVAIVDPKTKKPTRIGFKVDKGVKVRIAKSSGTTLAESRGKAPAAVAKEEVKDSKTKTIKA